MIETLSSPEPCLNLPNDKTLSEFEAGFQPNHGHGARVTQPLARLSCDN